MFSFRVGRDQPESGLLPFNCKFEDAMNLSDLCHLRRECAQTVLRLYHRAHAGHIGSSLSCLEILIDLYFQRMRAGDYCILSKGHAAAGLYTVLAKSGRMDPQELDTFYKDGTRLAAHPPCNGEISGIPFGTGSLGHGLSLAAGIAFSQRYTGRSFHVYCVLSDGDCNEGSTWEAALFAKQHALTNLTVVVDANGLQGFGATCDVCGLEPLEDKWRSFGFETRVAEHGNVFAELDSAHQAVALAAQNSNGPQCIIARTIKGHGVSYMENRMEWHYLPMSEEQYQLAIKETEQAHA
ncbi:MAG: transketolase [Kiritimatiellia bacterium]